MVLVVRMVLMVLIALAASVVLVHGFSASKAFYNLSGSGGSVKNVFGDNYILIKSN